MDKLLPVRQGNSNDTEAGASIHLNPWPVLLAGISFTALVVGLVSGCLRQPLVLIYLVVGVLLGSDLLGFVGFAGALGPP